MPRKRKNSRVSIDRAFIAEHTHGFEEFEACVRGHNWAELEIGSGLSRAAMEAAATVYAQAKSAIIGYGMGMTQHVNGVENVQMVVNLLLMRGNIGKPGAGVLPIRGHSNVQGQRTVGITEKPELVPNDKLKELYGFEPPKDKGPELHSRPPKPSSKATSAPWSSLAAISCARFRIMTACFRRGANSV